MFFGTRVQSNETGLDRQGYVGTRKKDCPKDRRQSESVRYVSVCKPLVTTDEISPAVEPPSFINPKNSCHASTKPYVDFRGVPYELLVSKVCPDHSTVCGPVTSVQLIPAGGIPFLQKLYQRRRRDPNLVRSMSRRVGRCLLSPHG